MLIPRDQQSRIIQSREVKFHFLEAAVQRKEDPKAPERLTMLINEIYESTCQATVEPDIKLNENGKK